MNEIRLIDAAAFEAETLASIKWRDIRDEIDIRAALKAAPTVQVPEERTAQWIQDPDDGSKHRPWPRCSSCGAKDRSKRTHCHGCGARMGDRNT